MDANNIQECLSKVQTLKKLGEDLDTRRIVLGILVNIVNAYFRVHPAAEEEIKALQEAFDKEDAYTKQLAEMLASNLSTPSAQTAENQDDVKGTEE